MSKKSTALRIFKDIKELRLLSGYKECGNCAEISIVLGIKLAKEGIVSHLKKGIVRNTMHFWLETPYGKMDPTKSQFPGLHHSEYPDGEHTGFDFEAMLIFLEG